MKIEEHHIKREVVAFLEDRRAPHLIGRSAGSNFLLKSSGNKEDHAEADNNLSSDSLHLYQFCFLYMLHYPVIYSLSERKRERETGSKHARNCVYLSKIEISSYHQGLVSHPMPEHVEALS